MTDAAMGVQLLYVVPFSIACVIGLRFWWAHLARRDAALANSEFVPECADVVDAVAEVDADMFEAMGERR